MYKSTSGTSVIRISDEALIPADPANADWQVYKLWVSKGNEPEPYILPIAPIPTTVTMRQAQLALLAANKLDAVDTLISTAPRAVQIAWVTAGTVERDNPLLSSLSDTLGLTSTDLDNLFLEASKL